MEEVEILHFVTVDIVNDGIIERNEYSLHVDFFNCTLDISFVLSINSDFPFIALRRSFLNVDLNTELILDALDLRPLRANDETDKRLVDPDFPYNREPRGC